MNVTVLSMSSRNAGGLFYSVRWLSKELTHQGCNMTVYSPMDEYSQEDLNVWNPVPVKLYPSFGPMNTSLGLRRMLRNSNQDLIHLHGIWLDNQWAAMQCQQKKNVPVIVSPRGMLDPWAVGNSAWKKKLVEQLFARKALERASCIHALCLSEVESIRAYGLKNPVALIPNAVELPEIGSPVRAGEEKKGKKQLLFLGRIHPKKGLPNLLTGWVNAKHQNPAAFADWQLLIAGWDDGNNLEGLKQQASQLGLSWSDSNLADKKSAELCFLGSKYGEGKEDLLRSVDAFILPSFSEGLPMSVLEAWSYGLPVVMTEFCNIPEGFESEAAIRIEPTDQSVSEGLNELFSMSVSQCEQMGLKGRALVERKFSWTKVAQDMKAVYEWCLGGPAPSVIKFD